MANTKTNMQDLTKELLLEYNSKRPGLVIPEYGRHVQKLIRHAQKIEDLELKQAFVDKVVDLMHQMNPTQKNVQEYREKLWKHLFRIATYDLDGVTPPNGQVPSIDESKIKPNKVEYPKSSFKFRHYGSLVQSMVNKAIAMEDQEMRDEYVQAIGYYMKIAYKNWNRDHYVNDDIIKHDLVAMSGGQITIAESFSLDHIKYTPSTSTPNRRKNNNNNNKRRSNKNRNYKKRNNNNRHRN